MEPEVGDKKKDRALTEIVFTWRSNRLVVETDRCSRMHSIYIKQSDAMWN